MKDHLANLPLIGDLSRLAQLTLFFNIILTACVILLAFKLADFKRRVDELEARIGKEVDRTMQEETPQTPVKRTSSRKG